MEVFKVIENKLEEVYKDAPPLSKSAKQTIVQYWPWVALVFGILQLAAVFWLWQAGHVVNNISSSVNTLSQAYGIQASAPQLGFFYWLSLLALLADGILLLVAFSPLRRREAKGWRLLFLGTLLYALYGFIALFDNVRGGIGSLIMALVGAAIGLYFLFQIKEFYKKDGNK